MPANIDDLIPSASKIQKEAALREAEKAEEYARVAAAAESEKRALIERLTRPSGKSEEEKIELASTVIQRAVRNGMTEVQVYRFPNSLCTDKGRAINQQEAGWESTLTASATRSSNSQGACRATSPSPLPGVTKGHAARFNRTKQKRLAWQPTSPCHG
jgi:hypothetical protein